MVMAGSRPRRRAAGRTATGVDAQGEHMSTTFFHLSTLAVLAVFVVLVLGLWNMMRGTSPNTSQKLMRWRVALQFLAILIVMGFFLLTR
jgi:hypothetical protein